MSKRAVLFVLSLLGSNCFSQSITKEYQYAEQGPSDDLQFVFTGSETMIVGSFQMTSAKTMIREIQFKADSFQMTSQRFKKRILIGERGGNNLAIMSARKSNRYDLDVQGVHYDWVKDKASQWQYQLDGKTVLEGKLSKAEGLHYFHVTLSNPDLADNKVLELASAHVAVSRIGKKTNAWIPIVAVAVAGLLLRPVIQSNF